MRFCGVKLNEVVQAGGQFHSYDFSPRDHHIVDAGFFKVRDAQAHFFL